MILYRGIKRLLVSQVNHLYQNKNDDFLDYGKGTSYSTKKSLALDYANGDHKWGLVFTMNFTPINPLYITSKNQIDEEDTIFHHGIFINGQTFKKKELSDYARVNNYDCIIFDCDESEGHVLITNPTAQLELKEIELYSDNSSILKAIKELNLVENDGLFSIPFNKILELDSILKELMY